jgi:hypothetical protein
MAQEEQYQIPVFLINGQLDSGKTSFISDTIEMGQFEEAKNNLLISVVFPAPKKPDIISTFVILNIHLSLYGLF